MLWSTELLSFWWPLVVMAVDWVAVARGWRRVEWVAKPAALAALLVWYVLRLSGYVNPMDPWIYGLAFSLLGDVLLLLKPRFFVFGLAAFLLAHIAYIVAFIEAPILMLRSTCMCRANFFPWRVTALPAVVVLAALVIIVAVWLGRRVTTALTKSGHSSLRVPVIAYTCILTTMVVAALTTLARPDWDLPGVAVLVVAGAGLFFVSDALLAWNRFVNPVSHGNLIVIIAYHLAQAAIILAVVQDFYRVQLL